MQQNYQNTYTVVKYTSGNKQAYQQITFNISPGIYDLDASMVNIRVNVAPNFALASDVQVYARSDCFVPANSFCIIQKDQKQIANFMNLALAQLEYRQQFMQDHDMQADYFNCQGDIQYPCISKKRWKKIGQQADSSATKTYTYGFRFKHFFPFLNLGANATEEKYLFVDKMMIIQLTLGKFDNSTFLSYQQTGTNLSTVPVQTGQVNSTDVPPVPLTVTLASGVHPTYLQVTQAIPAGFMNLKPCEASEADADPILMTLMFKKVNQNFYHPIQRPLYQSCYVQQQSYEENVVFNQPIQSHQISKYQSLSIIPTYSPITQFNFEDFEDDENRYIRVQRQGNPIIDATGLSDARAQAMLWKEEVKDDCQNLIIQFNEVLSDTVLQTNIDSDLAQAQVIVGLQYFEKI